MINLNVGIEIEASVNGNKIRNLEVGSWRSMENLNEFATDWATSRDGSIRNEHFDNGITCEFVTRKLKLKDVHTALENFKKAFGLRKLSDVLDFNSSCGCHIHFSTPKKLENTLIGTKYYKKLRNNVFFRIKEELPEVYPLFKEQYFRSYAQKQEGDFLDRNLRGEIAYTNLSKGVEWRSFNLKGVTTWDEFFKIFKIAFEEIVNIFEELERVSFNEEIEYNLNNKEIKKRTDNIRVYFGD